MLTISASDLRQWQTCRRRWLLERSWKVARWRPTALFRSCLREGVFALSNGSAVAPVRTTARTRFLSEAARPGLDYQASGDPWVVAQDWAGMLGTVLTAIARLTLLTLTKLPSTLVSEAADVSWLPLSWMDDSGTLHRWTTCDAFDDDTLAREGHSWHVIADMVMADAPMTLHIIEIGQQRSGRRVSPWARCYKHPAIAGLCRFQRPDGKGGWRKLAGEQWTSQWYADQTKPEPEAWCDLMDSDHVTPSLLHHIAIQQPSRTASARIRSEIQQVAEEMRSSAGRGTPAAGMDLPMARSACDPMGGPCPWQAACYREQPDADLAGLGLYQLRAASASSNSLTQRVDVATCV
jgi:hypothetical protein